MRLPDRIQTNYGYTCALAKLSSQKGLSATGTTQYDDSHDDCWLLQDLLYVKGLYFQTDPLPEISLEVHELRREGLGGSSKTAC